MRYEKDRTSDNNVVFIEQNRCVSPKMKLRAQISMINNPLACYLSMTETEIMFKNEITRSAFQTGYVINKA